MTDKVQKIRAEIERRIAFQKECIKNSCRLTGRPEEEIILEYKQLLSFINSLPEEPVSEDLGEYINELSKQFPEVSFAKLSRIAVRVAKWQKEQINEALLSEVLPCFMHGGEADEVVAKLDEVLNQKKKED